MRDEKGFTGIDIAICVIVIFTFVSIIANLSYRFNSSSKEIELKAKAVELAIEEIEEMKKIDYTQIENIGLEEQNKQYLSKEEIQGTENEGFYRQILVEDYALNHPEKIAGIVKKVSVQIQYNFKNKEQTVELSTIITKES